MTETKTTPQAETVQPRLTEEERQALCEKLLMVQDDDGAPMATRFVAGAFRFFLKLSEQSHKEAH